MSFQPLVQIEHGSIHLDKHICDKCPLDKIKGVHKILGKVKGKKIFIWPQSPGMDENRERKELVGRAGKFLWQELARVGIKRKHCDIQNVVRCVPVDVFENTWPRLRMRAPTKEEIKCCSPYNEKARHRSKARLHLIFGQIAGATLLKNEFSPQNKRIFYSENMHGWVVYLDHPSYFVRMGYSADYPDKAPNDALNRFREDLRKAKQILKKKHFDKFGFIKKQHYIGVTDRKTAIKAYRELKAEGEHTGWMVYDMESGKVDENEEKPDDNGKYVALCCGFATRAGKSYVFCLSKVFGVCSGKALRLNHKLVRKLLQNKHIKKCAHYGVSDFNAVKDQLGFEVKRYEYDTLLGEYFRDPDAKAYGLEKVAERRFPDFMGYKDIRWPEGYTEEYRKKIEGKKITLERAGEVASTTGKMNLARLPWKKMVLYNGADDHLEFLVHASTKKYVNPPLMAVYRDASFILHQMEQDPKCQPLFDLDWSKKLDPIFVTKQRRLARKLKKAAGKYAYIPKRIGGKIDWIDGKRYKKRFNPDSPDHLNWLVYDKWRIPVTSEGRNARKGTLTRIALRHKKVRIVPRYNAEKKVVTTYLVSFRKCAELNDGHLRTNWKTTGTGTGRLSSGATKDKKNLKVINLQNVHGDPLIKCQIISDIRWRKLYDYWRKHGDFTKHTWKKFKDYIVQLGFDFCLDPNTRILTSDFRWKRIGKLEVGDELIGFEEAPRGGQGTSRRRLELSTVEKVRRIQLPCYKIITDRGEFISSEDHGWLRKYNGKERKLHGKRSVQGYEWIKTKDLKEGDGLGYLVKPWEEDKSRDGGYVSGILDGEGWVQCHGHKRHPTVVGFGQNPGIVLDKVCGLLEDREFKLDGPSGESKCKKIRIFNGDNGAFSWMRVLGTFRPSRLLHNVKDKWEGMAVTGPCSVDARILKIEYIGTREVVAMRTSTRTFVAEGFLSHNSQNELRELAEQSQDKNLIKAFCGGRDPHAEVGHELTGWDREVIIHDERVRRVIKAMHFGIVFGLQGEGLYQFIIAQGGKTTRHEVDNFLQKYFRKYPRVKWLQDKYRKFVEKYHYVVNPYGFRRKVNVEEQKEAEEAGEERRGGWWGNVAINTPIQSAAHHFLTMVFAVLHRKPEEYKKMNPQLEVHDALYVGVKLKHLLEAAKQGYKLMVDEPMRISEEEFGIKKKVSLATKPKAGFRFGVHIEGIGKEGLDTEWGFLNAWCRENRKLEKSYYKQLAELGGRS